MKRAAPSGIRRKVIIGSLLIASSIFVLGYKYDTAESEVVGIRTEFYAIDVSKGNKGSSSPEHRGVVGMIASSYHSGTGLPFMVLEHDYSLYGSDFRTFYPLAILLNLGIVAGLAVSIAFIWHKLERGRR